MKPLILHDHELNHLLTLEKGQTFMLARPMEPQPTWDPGPDPGNRPGNYEFHKSIDPFGPPGSEFFVQRESGGHLFTLRKDGTPITDFTTPSSLYSLTLKLIGTEVKRVQEVTDEEAEFMGVLPLEWAEDMGIHPADLEGHKFNFEHQWQSNHSDKLPWTDNPWAFLPTFERI